MQSKLSREIVKRMRFEFVPEFQSVLFSKQKIISGVELFVPLCSVAFAR